MLFKKLLSVLSHITVLFSFCPFVDIHIQIRVLIREIKTFEKSTRVLFAKLFIFTDNYTDLDVNVNERTKGDQHSDM